MYSGEWSIEDFDPDLAKALKDELRRQEEQIELIASENYASPRVLEAQGSVLTNKYAHKEGPHASRCTRQYWTISRDGKEKLRDFLE